ncbi:MAG TPA: hypothetical protein VFB54_03135 [Burkholderiales bacterium]|nr:hypothetical protein [Burkholderiales bacterium]
MSTLLDIARHPFAAFGHSRREIDDVAQDARDPYERQRSQRLAQLEAAGKCLARSGKHDNLRYWPSECGSRVLAEHRRRQRPARTATHA